MSLRKQLTSVILPMLSSSIFTPLGYLEETSPSELFNSRKIISCYPNMRLPHMWCILIYVASCPWKGSRISEPEWLSYIFQEHQSTQLNLLNQPARHSSYQLVIECLLCAKHCAKCFTRTISANCTRVPKVGDYYFEFMDEETESQKCWVTCPVAIEPVNTRLKPSSAWPSDDIFPPFYVSEDYSNIKRYSLKYYHVFTMHPWAK